MRICYTLLTAFALLALNGTATAQTQITTAVIEGVVIDASGARAAWRRR